MPPPCCSKLLFILLLLFFNEFSSGYALQQPVALLTGATGRTGQLVTNMLLDEGYQICIFCRDETKAKTLFEGRNNQQHIQYCQGDLNNKRDIKCAFSSSNKEITHVVFMAGGEDADYRCVNYKGLAAFCEEATAYESIRQFVVISTAWTTRPYSIASLLFNSLYPETVPMASHFLGEQALRQIASSVGSQFNYIIVRAGGLNSDDRYSEKYPEAAKMGLSYQQGDTFEFFGVAGRPGMSRSQLAHAVVTATTMTANGRHTVEVTGSGTTDWTDGTIYDNLKEDEGPSTYTEDELYTLHTQAVQQLKTTALVGTIGGIGLISMFGILPGLVVLAVLDVLMLLVWSRFFATRQVC